MNFGHMGNMWLSGPDREVWKDNDLSELICPRPDEGHGAFARFISHKPLKWYHYTLGYLFRVRINQSFKFPGPEPGSLS